jgi:hypothetical protein
MTDVLDYPVWASLVGRPHAEFAQVKGQAARYPPEFAPFLGVAPSADEHVWDDIAELVGPGGVATMAGAPYPAPPKWKLLGGLDGVQMIFSGVAGDVADDHAAVALGPAHVPAILAGNAGATRLYESLGFRVRRHLEFTAHQAPP